TKVVQRDTVITAQRQIEKQHMRAAKRVTPVIGSVRHASTKGRCIRNPRYVPGANFARQPLFNLCHEIFWTTTLKINSASDANVLSSDRQGEADLLPPVPGSPQ